MTDMKQIASFFFKHMQKDVALKDFKGQYYLVSHLLEQPE